jgi:uncharacterized membrane protein
LEFGERPVVITDQKVELAISVLLRAGVLLAAAVVLVGGALYLAQHGSQPTAYRVFHGEPQELRHPEMVLRAALSGRADAIIQLGLLLLILTPVARVAFSVAAFAVERDVMYMVMTLIVLAVLLYSLVGG